MSSIFKCFSKKKYRVHSVLGGAAMIHAPLYNHIVKHNGMIAKGAKIIYNSGNTEIVSKNLTIFVIDPEETPPVPLTDIPDNSSNPLHDMHYTIMNMFDFKQCIDEDKQCFIMTNHRIHFLRNIYLVKEPGCFGKQYM